ncbi:MAG TPA: helicase-associated domain-containing protein, partial [Jatrophihabitantaceae bacterium]|nr:helicase-associated domain-containing protein [Jatrophihabitantaceae bacterium]
LINRGLLVAIDAQTVELPRELGLALRAVPVGEVQPTPPDVPVTAHSPDALDRMGTSAVLEALRLVAALADSWAAQPPAMLRSGGIGVRDLRRTARDLGIDDAAAALFAEVAAAAGLIGPTNGIEPVYLPTTDYDTWLRRAPAARWSELATAWLGMSRQPSLVSQRDERDRLIPALGPDAERGAAPALRQHVLEALTSLPPGAAPNARADILAWLAWQNPRRAQAQRAVTEAMLTESDLLGVTAAGGLTGYTRTLLAGSRAAAEQALSNALPDPVDSIVVQPDLTVVVPGPPVAELAAELALIADLESSGGASVYRITEASIRRALDAGRSAGDLRRMLTERSRTPIPQGLSYLIDDVARRHGVLRVGAASAYLRCDDEALLARVVADRDVESAQLRRIAPTVLVSALPVNRVLDVLRTAGYAPAAEAPGGDIITLGIEAARAPSRTPVRVIRPRGTIESDAQMRELIRRIRAGDTMTELTRTVHPVAQQVPGVTSATTMATLRQAIREGRRVLLGHADPDGTATRHTILPISLAGGFVRGHEDASQRLQSFPLHRLTAVRILGEDGDDDSA